jgi:hypothetical protein
LINHLINECLQGDEENVWYWKVCWYNN